VLDPRRSPTFHAIGGESRLLCQNDDVQTVPHAWCAELPPVTPELTFP
jgi:hypothetical protein